MRCSQVAVERGLDSHDRHLLGGIFVVVNHRFLVDWFLG